MLVILRNLHYWHKCKGTLKRIWKFKKIQDGVNLLVIVSTYIVQPICVKFLWCEKFVIKYDNSKFFASQPIMLTPRRVGLFY